MNILDIFKKRKPTHLIIYVLYNNEESFLYNLLSRLTYSIGPYSSIDKCIEDVKKFIKKYPDKLKQINITSFGTGKFLVQTTDDKLKVYKLMDALKPIINNETKFMFTTCFSGVVHRRVVEMSEYMDGMEIAAMEKSYSLNGKMTICKCKEKGYSENIISKIPKSKNGIVRDEKQIIEIIRRDEGEEINWDTCGVAYEYNKITVEEGICRSDKQPYTLLKSIRNYLFNIQK